MRRFNLYRHKDPTGVSGTGIVAQGVQFKDGIVAMRWVVNGAANSTVIYDSIFDVEDIHGHGGDTTVAWWEED